MSDEELSQAWVAATVRELREAGSWTGRIHIHKLISVVELLGLAHQPFEFELYYYGPYSRELDWTIAVMGTLGHLEREYPKQGYGPQYCVESSGPKLPRADTAIVRKVANAFGKRDSKALELIATCLWVNKREKLTQDTQIVDRVQALKPKYEREEIESGLREAQELEAKLPAA